MEINVFSHCQLYNLIGHLVNRAERIRTVRAGLGRLSA